MIETDPKKCKWYALVFSILVVAPLTWEVVDRRPAFLMKDGATVPAVLQPGKPYQLSWTVRTVMDNCYEVTVHRMIIDKEKTPHLTEGVPSLFAANTFNTPTRAAGRERLLQSSIPDGPVTIRTWAISKCNFIQWFFNWPVITQYPDIQSTVKFEVPPVARR